MSVSDGLRAGGEARRAEAAFAAKEQRSFRQAREGRFCEGRATGSRGNSLKRRKPTRASGRTPSNPRWTITDSREDQSPEVGFPDSCCCPNNAGARSHTRAEFLPRSSSQRSPLPTSGRLLRDGPRHRPLPDGPSGPDGGRHRFGPGSPEPFGLQVGSRLTPVHAARSSTRLFLDTTNRFVSIGRHSALPRYAHEHVLHAGWSRQTGPTHGLFGARADDRRAGTVKPDVERFRQHRIGPGARLRRGTRCRQLAAAAEAVAWLTVPSGHLPPRGRTRHRGNHRERNERSEVVRNLRRDEDVWSE
jgi:hypothetical protein